jgi:hypothetical protein
MGKHSRVSAFEVELDKRWEQGGYVFDHSSFVRLTPGLWHREIDTVCIGFE